MMKKIIYTQPNGVVAVVHPADGARLAYSVRFVDGSSIPQASHVLAPLPVDRIFRHWPVNGATAEWAESEEEFLDRVRRKSVPVTATNIRIVDASEIPADRTFRDGWIVGADAAVEHDMVKCREILRTRIREARKSKFEALDVAYMCALERGASPSEVAAIVAQKQALRDAPSSPAIAAANTTEALKAAWPQILK